MNRRFVLSASSLVLIAGCNNPLVDTITKKLDPKKSSDRKDKDLDITKDSRPKSRISDLENSLRDLYISYYKTSRVEDRYTKYCVQESGVLEIMKSYYGNSLLTAKLDPSEIPISSFRIKYVSSNLGKIMAETTKTGRNAFNAEIEVSNSYFFRNTPSGYRIDWMSCLYEYIENKEYFCNIGRLFGKGDSIDISIDDLENIPERYKDRTLLIKNVSLNGFSNTYIDNLPGVTIDSNGLVSTIDIKAKERWIGIRIKQQDKFSTYWKCFTLKENYDKLKAYIDKPNIRLNLRCQLIQLERSGGDYGVVVTDFDVFEYSFFGNGEAIPAENFR